MSREKEKAEVHGLDPWGLRQVEQLLVGLHGVSSLKIVPDGHGGIDEVHVVSPAGFGAKQVVRNIESALLAEFGLQIDHRKISVAQMNAPDIAAAEQVDSPPVDEELPAASTRRLLLESLQIERKAGQKVVCRVTLTDGEDEVEGSAEGPDFSRSRLEVAAHAVLRALNSATIEQIRLRLEGVTRLNAFGHDLVVAVVQGQERRRAITLPGVSVVTDSPEEAAVLACLHATNRWTGAT